MEVVKKVEIIVEGLVVEVDNKVTGMVLKALKKMERMMVEVIK